MNYERMSHYHCWNQDGDPACGIALEKHEQCCLCDLKYPHEAAGWEEEYDKLGNRKAVKDFIHRLLKDQQERIVSELEEKLKRPSGNTNAADFYNTGILDAIEVVKNS